MHTTKHIQKCAIIQLEAVHEEIIPSIVHSLNQIDIEPDIYINRKCKERRGDLFCLFRKLRFRVNYIRVDVKEDWDELKNKIVDTGYSFVILSTFQHEGICAWTAQLNMPVIGVVHNAKLFLERKSCLDQFLSESVGLVFLAPHVGAFFHLQTKGAFLNKTCILEPVYWSYSSQSWTNPDSFRRPLRKRRIIVPGSINYKTRDLSGLLDAVRSLQSEGSKIEILLAGGGADRNRLIKECTDMKLNNIIKFARVDRSLDGCEMVPYNEYFSALRSSDILLPMLPLEFTPYKDHKITSSLFTAIGFSLPTISDRWTARVYRLPIIEESGSMYDLIGRCTAISDYCLKVSRYRVTKYRRKLLAENAEQIAGLVEEITDG